MKRQWNLKRQLIEQDDGQRRWDQAYQLLIRLTMTSNADSAPSQGEEVTCEVTSSGVSR